jgi:ATP-dependent DNA helicase RecG
VLLAPTEVLAQQHFATLTNLLGPLAQAGQLGAGEDATGITLVTGSLRSRQRRDALAALVQGTAGIAVGTHALLEQSVEFADLGLVVIDEQHRFGVEQRAVLSRALPDGTRPHVLVMTATPIPRTVAMTVFGDLDVSVLDEAPPGRQPIATHVVVPKEKPAYLARIWTRIAEEVAAGRKAYVVCPRIGDDGGGGAEGTETLEDGDHGDASTTPMSSVLDVVVDLRDRLLPDLRIGMLHGRMSAEAKEQVMGDFAADHSDPRALDVLVATTVIEVGVDVPQASVMVIMDADRFGISQLHQLRGRVGRGDVASLCLLVTSAEAGSPGRERLDAVASTTDGFELARVDLQTRREGDVLGSMQSGRRSSLQLLQVLRDEDIVRSARDTATEIVATDTDLRRHRPLRAAVARLLDQERTDFLEKG